MPILRSCLAILEDGNLCGELSPETRCPPHRREFERKRKEDQPWLHLYTHPAWARCRLEVFRRDGYRCTFTNEGRRCANTDLLEAHHEEKLRLIWKRCGEPQRGSQNWSRFVREATNSKQIRALCPRCHKFVDDNPFMVDGTGKRIRVGREPRPPFRGTSASRRGRQHTRRRRTKGRGP